MKKFLILLFMMPFAAFSQNENENKYVAIRGTKLYELSPPHDFIEIIPKGYAVKVVKISDNITVLEYNGKMGFTETENLSDKKSLLKKSKTINYGNYNLDMLVKYTVKHRLSQHMFYGTTTISTVFAVPTIIFSEQNKKNNGYYGRANTHREEIIICGTLSGVFGLAALVSGICVYEFQSKINKTTTNLQLKANGFSIAF